jgi:hypothetical protein
MAGFKVGKSDVSMVVWLGIIALLFIAVAVHEGWFSGGAVAGAGEDGVSPGVASDAAATVTSGVGGLLDSIGDGLDDLLALSGVM